MAHSAGVEPATLRVETGCSCPLSYECWSTPLGSNQRPRASETRALSTELGVQVAKTTIACRFEPMQQIMKRCPACAEQKPATLEFFYKGSQWKDGFKPYCKRCQIAQARVYALADPVRARANRKKWRDKNPSYQRERRAARLKDNPALRAQLNAKKAASRLRNLETSRQRSREQAKRRRSVAKGRIDHRIGQWFRQSMRRTPRKFSKWEATLGYTVNVAREHIERQFLSGMAWDNHGEWQIDHIVPLHMFRYSSALDPEVRRAWALTNLRPVWKHTNMQKSYFRTHLV